MKRIGYAADARLKQPAGLLRFLRARDGGEQADEPGEPGEPEEPEEPEEPRGTPEIEIRSGKFYSAREEGT